MLASIPDMLYFKSLNTRTDTFLSEEKNMKYQIEKTRMTEPTEPIVEEITIRTENFTILVDDEHVHVWNKNPALGKLCDVSCRLNGQVRVMAGEVIE
jgi:hypothetical protein